MADMLNRRVGIVYNPRAAEAAPMAEAIVRQYGLDGRSWTLAATDMDGADSVAKGSSLVISIGGDGTILRTQRIAAPWGVPVVGINLGRLGFMTELRRDEVSKLSHYLEGKARVEERAMVTVQVLPQGNQPDPAGGHTYHALNDVVVGRGSIARLVRIDARVDGAALTVYRADAVIISTATGSTGYNLSAGGPILFPTSKDFVMKAVASHLGLGSAVVLPSTSTIDLALVESDGSATLSIDGYIDLTVTRGDVVRITLSPQVARFLRGHDPAHYFATLMLRLGAEAPPPPRAIF